MVKKLVLLLIICSSWVFAALQYLTKSIVPQTAFEDVATVWNASDDDTLQVNIGFLFPFNGTTYTNVWINSNGMLSFSSRNNRYSNSNLPYTREAQSVYPYWDDLNPRVRGNITYGLLGTAPNRHFVISWNAIPHYSYGGSYSIQVVLYENGDIRFRYDSLSSTNGSSATVGVQENTSNYDVHSYNSINTFDVNTDVLYQIQTARMSIVKDSCILFDPINGTSNPKRITGATIRYALEVKNEGSIAAGNVILTDTVDSIFLTTSIQNLQIQQGRCDCLGVSSSSSNGVNGSANGVNPILLDFGDIAGTNDPTIPVFECGYFEVDLL